MNAIEWMKARATTLEAETIQVTADAADHAGEVGTYEVTRLYFGGYIPAHMTRAAGKIALTNNATTNEVFRFNPKNGHAEYFHTTYKKVA